MEVQQNGAVHVDIESKLPPRRDRRITFQIVNEFDTELKGMSLFFKMIIALCKLVIARFFALLKSIL